MGHVRSELCGILRNGHTREGLEFETAQPLGREALDKPPLLDLAEDEHQLAAQPQRSDGSKDRPQRLRRRIEPAKDESVVEKRHHQKNADERGAAKKGVEA